MKTILSFCLLIAFGSLKAQDIITLKSGETINAKVAEVGINEIKYYKATNLQGPLYVTGKADINTIKYANGTIETFPAAGTQQLSTAQPPNVVNQPAPQTVIVQQRPRRRIRPYMAPVFVPHIDLGHRINIGHGGGHHGGGHH